MSEPCMCGADKTPSAMLIPQVMFIGNFAVVRLDRNNPPIHDHVVIELPGNFRQMVATEITEPNGFTEIGRQHEIDDRMTKICVFMARSASKEVQP